ncbi:MAG: HDOD domain-containing protein [Chitinispirillales bacterium]|jgi:putative nucleotidyltransferase with HDIG domain|nr:HDOD domain-containing protein [Chitinispirillales bacterium]
MSNQTAAGTIPGVKERAAQIVENADRLPSLPTVVLKLMDVVNSSGSSADDASKLIDKDPALTSKMIRLANSAFYGIPRSISSVSSAVVILGFNTIRSLVLSASVAKMFDGKHSIDMDRYWKHSIVTAMISKIIVRHLMSVRMVDPESAFCAGILHDIGKLVFSQHMPDDYAAVCDYAKKEGIPLIEAEDELLGINHEKMGSILAEKWTLPPDLGCVLAHHHDPKQAAEEASYLVNIVHLSDVIAHNLGCGLFDDEVCTQEAVQCRLELKIGNSDYDKIVQNVENSIDKSNEFLSVIVKS